MSTEEERLSFVRQEVGQIWCSFPKKVMDVELAKAFVEVLKKANYAPHLGCATTKELLDEISAHCEVGSAGLEYRTVDGDKQDA